MLFIGSVSLCVCVRLSDAINYDIYAYRIVSYRIYLLLYAQICKQFYRAGESL